MVQSIQDIVQGLVGGGGDVRVHERGRKFLFRFDKYKVLASTKAWVDIWEGGHFFVITV